MTSTVRRDRSVEVPGLRAVCESAVYPHVFGKADREVGGVLVGRASLSGDLPLVTGAIEARMAEEHRADLTFTHDTWEHVHWELERRAGADERIVGWYHSHPGFGIFLSEHDRFVHRHFFSDPSQIALVVDPLAGSEGLFVWRQGDVEEAFTRGTPRRWVAAEAAAPVVPASSRRSSALLVYLAALLVGVLAGLALYQQLLATDAAAPTRRVAPPSASAIPDKPATPAKPDYKSKAPKIAGDDELGRPGEGAP